MSAVRPAAHVIDGDGDRLHRHAVVAELAPQRREGGELEQAGDGAAMKVSRPADDIVVERHDDHRAVIAVLDAEIEQLRHKEEARQPD